ncbi:MAG: enoyl-CoA hydratase [Candidatus Rokubacteria bacterium]|nr:enoyl-CoA hydratase [Candidatus Rokubacteria bacterium]
MGYRTILVEKTQAIATVTLNRPEARNALDLTMREELTAAFRDLNADEAVRVVILTGAGGHFCAGGDVKAMRQRLTAADGRIRVQKMNEMVMEIVNFQHPVIAMVEGFAVGAGCNLALACDLIIASDRAQFGEVFAKVGLIPDAGGTHFLPRRVGLAKAKELVFSAEVIGAVEAERIGLINRAVPSADLRAVTDDLARKIAEGPPRVLGMAKQLLNRSLETDLGRALELEAFGQGMALEGEEHREGVAAFFEKRPPRFTGQER